MAKKISFFDFLSKEAIEIIDKTGYDLLAANGYDVNGAVHSKKKRAKLINELKADGRQLTYFTAVDDKTGKILFWFALYEGDKVIATSKGLSFLPNKGVANGERESQERPSGTPEDNT